MKICEGALVIASVGLLTLYMSGVTNHVCHHYQASAFYFGMNNWYTSPEMQVLSHLQSLLVFNFHISLLTNIVSLIRKLKHLINDVVRVDSE